MKMSVKPLLQSLVHRCQMCDAEYMMSSQSGSDRETNIILCLHKDTKDHSLSRAENTTYEGAIYQI